MRKYVRKIVLMMLFLSRTAALAESGSGAQGMVDLTGVIVSMGLLAFDLLLGWAAKNVLPALAAWLKERTSESQRRMLCELTAELVRAAEQIIGAGLGGEKMKYVIDGLEARGFTADTDLIEAEVRKMNERALQAMREELCPAQTEGT